MDNSDKLKAAEEGIRMINQKSTPEEIITSLSKYVT
jgi:hypothetical protein